MMKISLHNALYNFDPDHETLIISFQLISQVQTSQLFDHTSQILIYNILLRLYVLRRSDTNQKIMDKANF
jgi:hypothetical protein